MSIPNETQAVARNKVVYLKMYRALVGVGTLCGGIIILVYQFTAPIIQTNRKIALENAIFKILPSAATKKAYIFGEEGKFVINDATDYADIVYAGFDSQQQLVGFVISAQGMGYQDSIELLYAYDHIQQIIIGMTVIHSIETPGLGSRIENDSNFLKNFNRLDVKLNSNQTELENQLKVVKPGKKTDPWQIDSITGATISSNAIGNIIQQSANRWLPAIKQHYKDFKYDN